MITLGLACAALACALAALLIAAPARRDARWACTALRAQARARREQQEAINLGPRRRPLEPEPPAGRTDTREMRMPRPGQM